MSNPCALDLLKRYATARGGQFSRPSFLAWAAHHGLRRDTDPLIVDAAFRMAVELRVIERVGTPEAAVHPLFQPVGMGLVR